MVPKRESETVWSSVFQTDPRSDPTTEYWSGPETD
jgi:hypothetical protein